MNQCQTPGRSPWILVLAFSLVAPARFARSEGLNAIVAAPSVYTATALNAMNLENVARVSDEFSQLAAAIAVIMRREDGAPVRYDHVRQLGTFHALGSQQLLYRLIRSEFKRALRPKVGFDPRLLREAIDTLASFGAFGRSHPTDLSLEFDELIEEAASDLQHHVHGVVVDADLRAARDAMGARLVNLPDLQTLLNRQDAATGGGISARLERVETHLRRLVVGHEHVISGIIKQLWDTHLEGGRTQPLVAYLTGPVGMGHRTVARSLARALNGFPTADVEHMLEIPPMQDKDELWTLMGSATGYYGSESGVPELLAWLVRHSGGQYAIEVQRNERDGEKFRVLKDPTWRPGEVRDNYASPDKAVLYVGNVQLWSKGLKDKWLLPAMKSGTFKINNPNGGETSITVPVNVIIGGTEGTSLISSKELNGQRHGKPLSFERMRQKFLKAYRDPGLIQSAIMQTNGSANNTSSDKSPGVSETFMRAIPKAGLYLLGPFDPAEMTRIAEQHLRAFANRLHGGNELLGRATLLWSEAVTELIATYDVEAEDGALGVDERIRTLIKDPLIDLVRARALEPGTKHSELALDVRVNADRTRSLIARFTADGAAPTTHEAIIAQTLKDQPRASVSEARINHLIGLPDRLNQKVFGIEPIVQRLSDRALSIANEATSDEPQPATVIAMDGWTSTGKTQTAKEFAAEILPPGEELVTFDFSRIQSARDFKEELMGLRDERGNSIPSRFMKEYDRAGGRLVVALDELANVRDPEQLKVLYDLLREEVIYTFSDNKPRPMTEVVFLITGNATQGFYSRVPSNLPRDVQMHAWEGIYHSISRDYGAQRTELAKTYPEPLLTRIQKNNTFVMPPHTWKTLRQLAQLKLKLALKALGNTRNRRGWEVVFPDAAEYSRFLDVIVDEGFELKDQGASIDKYVTDDFKSRIQTFLMRHKVPSGARVVLAHAGATANDDDQTPGVVNYDVYVDGLERLRFEMPRAHVPRPLNMDPNVLLKTAYHEAGHSLLNRVMFPGGYVPLKLSVIEGVAKIAGDYIYYAGIASDQQVVEMSITRDWIVRQIAVYLAGETAERLVTRGGAHASGKANDIEGVATLAQNAILRYGLSAEWGLSAIPRGESVEIFKGNLPERDKLLLRDEAQKLVTEGHQLARAVIEANFDDVFVPLGVTLAEKGEMNRAEIIQFYDDHVPVHPFDRSKEQRRSDRLRTRERKLEKPSRASLSPEILASLPRPRQMANIRQIVADHKRKMFDEVGPPEHPPLGRNHAFETQATPKLLAPPRNDASCGDLLTGA